MLYNRVDSISAALKEALTTTHELCELVDTPRSLAVSLMLQYHEWAEYLDLSIDPSTYEDHQHFADDYLVTEILRKHEDIPLGIDRVKVAIDSFKESEATCKLFNQRKLTDMPLWFGELQRNVYKLLGPLTAKDLSSIEDLFRFGPGASTGVRGKGSSLSDKYDKPLHLTTGLLPFFRSILGEQWWEHHRQAKHRIVEGNKFTTVPKSAKTDRGICVEPTLNMYVQLGIGTHLKKRLKRFGLDLTSQERNRELAQRAYSENLCTIDLSAASDSVSWRLVELLLPERWFHLLEICRSDFCDLGDEVVELEKWSSMGNGYTFELESLIFYAVCMTMVPFDEHYHISVFGDDIIVPQKYAPAVVEALEALAFKVNHRKSFLAGNFFESCGHDYFKGHNVRPFYLKKEKDIPFPLQAANKLRLYAQRMNAGWSCDRRYYHIWTRLVGSTPRIWKRCKVPADFGDRGLITSFDEAAPPKANNGWSGWIVKHIGFVPKYRRKRTFGVLLAAYARRGSSLEDPLPILVIGREPDDGLVVFTKGRETLRGYLGKPRTRTSVVQQWTCGLDWT